MRRQRRLAARRWAVQQHRSMPQPLLLPHILDVQEAVVDDGRDARREVDDAVRDRVLELRLIGTKGGLDFVERVEKVLPADLHIDHVVTDAGRGAGLDVSRKGERRG